MARQRVVRTLAGPTAVLVLLVLATGTAWAQGVESDLQAWWAAANPAARAEAAAQIVRSGSDFTAVYEALAAGRRYEGDVPRGTVELTRANGNPLCQRT